MIFQSLPTEELTLITERLKSVTCKKGESLVVPGQIQKNLYVVKKGVQMSYFDVGPKTHVVAFTYPPNLCAVPESFSLQAPSKCFLTCITDSEFDYLTFDELQTLFDKSPKIERLFRKLTESILAGIINRHMELHSLTMEDRYKLFCERSPHLLHVIPHKYIASYLSIDPTNFSKLFNRVKI
jgi:CRP-like cAMP-binding protein